MIVTSKACACDILGAVLNPLDGLANGERRYDSTHIARANGHLVAKTTTNIRRDNANTMLRKASNDGKEGTHHVWCLRRDPDGQFTCRLVVVRNTATRLNWGRENTRNIHILFDNNAIGCCLGDFRIVTRQVAWLPM